MEITIDIPNEFVVDYAADKFNDFFLELLQILTIMGCVAITKKETAEMFIEAFKNSSSNQIMK